ncbi:hypothetical protein Tco_0143973 [Tanacetum coccineum]
MSKKDLLKLDEELAFNLQAEEKQEERLAREKSQQIKEVNIAWDDVVSLKNIESNMKFVHYVFKSRSIN